MSCRSIVLLTVMVCGIGPGLCSSASAGGKKNTFSTGSVGKVLSHGGPLAPEMFRRKQGAGKVAPLTDAAISTLKRLIKVTDDADAKKPAYCFRLAEHYREKRTAIMFSRLALEQKIHRAASGTRARLKARHKKLAMAERAWSLESIKAYLAIAVKPAFKKFKRMDAVLFHLADLLNKANRMSKARTFFGRLIRNYPQSKHIPDAYLSFAEYYFATGKVASALKLYQQVSRYTNTPVYGYAVYRQGICWHKLKDPRRALEMFVKVIKHASSFKCSPSSKAALVTEAKNSIVSAYAVVGTPHKARSFFRRVGGSSARTMLKRLKRVYQQAGKSADAQVIDQQLGRP